METIPRFFNAPEDSFFLVGHMVRTQVYLTKEEKTGLETTASSQGVSQSDLIRRAIDELLAKTGRINKIPILDDIADIWSTRCLKI
jgi:hypothetical protein